MAELRAVLQSWCFCVQGPLLQVPLLEPKKSVCCRRVSDGSFLSAAHHFCVPFNESIVENCKTIQLCFRNNGISD